MKIRFMAIMALLIAVGCGPPRLDMSSNEAFNDSWLVVQETLTDEENEALATQVFSKGLRAGFAAQRENPDAKVPEFSELFPELHGMTGREALEYLSSVNHEQGK